MAIQIEATEQFFPVVLFDILYKVILTFESVDEIQMSLMKAAVYLCILFL